MFKIGGVDKQVITARIDVDVVDEIKSMEVPISRVIEAGLNYFISLDDTEKKMWFLQNSSEIKSLFLYVNSEGQEDIKKVVADMPWRDLVKPSSLSSIKTMIPTIANIIPGGMMVAGVTALIGALLIGKSEEIIKKKEEE